MKSILLQVSWTLMFAFSLFLRIRKKPTGNDVIILFILNFLFFLPVGGRCISDFPLGLGLEV